MTTDYPKQFASAFGQALSNTNPIRYLTKGNCTVGMATGLLRNLGRGHKDLEKPEPDLGIVVADFSDREILVTPIQFILGCFEILEADNPLWYK